MLPKKWVITRKVLKLQGSKVFPGTDSILSVLALYDDTRGSSCMFWGLLAVGDSRAGGCENKDSPPLNDRQIGLMKRHSARKLIEH